jgi:TetR/AcrR family transcriptional regulator
LQRPTSALRRSNTAEHEPKRKRKVIGSPLTKRGRSSPIRLRDPIATKARILSAATDEFASKGFGDAKIDKIAARSKCNVGMLYRYFKNKEGLYLAVLESVYADLRHAENSIDYTQMDPVSGLLSLFEFTHDHFERNPTLIRIMISENMSKAMFLRRSAPIRRMASPVLKIVSDLLKRGEKTSSIRVGIDPLQLYTAMVALSYFHLSNVDTLSCIFDTDFASPRWKRKQLAQARDMINCFIKPQARGQ